MKVIAHLHGIIDCKTRSDHSAGAVNVHGDVLFRIIRLKVQQLGNNKICYVVVDLSEKR